MTPSDFLCAYCVDNPAISMELDDGKQRPVCRVCSAEDVPDPGKSETMTDRVLDFVKDRPGASSGAMRVAWKLDRMGLEKLMQVLRLCVRSGRLTRTGAQWHYQYWPAAKKEAA